MSMKKSENEIVVIGGGAAGMFAAITAASEGKRVLLLEKNNRLGKKLAITGKGRCNVTNNTSAENVLRSIPRNGRFLFSAMQAFPPERAMRFFEQNGCPLKTERGDRVFPVSDRSADVIAALERAMRQAGVTRRHDEAVSVLTRDGAVEAVKTKNGLISTDAVILCTGGLSYPATGSTGDGYLIAQRLGHRIEAPVGSLVPMESPDLACAAMQGLSLRNTALRLVNEKGKTVFSDFGELIFTHFGISGPMALSASAHCKPNESYTVVLDLKPALTEEKLEARFLRDLTSYSNRSMENALSDLYPRSMIPVLLERCGIDPMRKANSLTKAERRALIAQTKTFSVAISALRPVKEAIITRGGVCVKEIDPKTMASKLARGLYFAGEIIDCDAYTGGFNLQIAWATAYAAGMAAANNV